MGGIEKISVNISKKLGERLDKTTEEIAVINYGLFALIHTSLAVFITLIVGLATGMFLEIMTISITASLLKRYSGGVHSSTPERCLISGLILSIILSVLCKYLSNIQNTIFLTVITAVGMIYSYYIIYKKCPVPSKNKPLKKESTRMRLRKSAFKLINIYSIIIIIMYFIYIIYKISTVKVIMIAILLGILLQIFAMTKSGEKFIDLLEKLFNYVKVI